MRAIACNCYSDKTLRQKPAENPALIGDVPHLVRPHNAVTERPMKQALLIQQIRVLETWFKTGFIPYPYY